MLQASEISYLDVATPLKRVVVAIDPPLLATEKDPCHAIIAGISQDDVIVVQSCHAFDGAPTVWRSAVHNMALEYDASVAADQWCFEMVAAIIRPMGGGVPLTRVRTKRGRYHRMEKVWAMYVEGRVQHACEIPLLEREICEFDHLPGAPHNYLDVLCFAIEALLPRQVPANFRLI